MLWLKAFHIIFVVTWFAGLFYLPRLFVYHAMAPETGFRDSLKIMERRLMIMTHLGGALTWLFGAALLFAVPSFLLLGWMKVKLFLVLCLAIYHFWCLLIVKQLARDDIRHGHVWFRWFNELPTVILIAVVILAVVKPF